MLSSKHSGLLKTFFFLIFQSLNRTIRKNKNSLFAAHRPLPFRGTILLRIETAKKKNKRTDERTKRNRRNHLRNISEEHQQQLQ